jgi:hypothetical protein
MISAGLNGLNLDISLSSARREILLLAPPYGNFRKSPQICSALSCALSHPQGASLRVLCLPDPNVFTWAGELMSLLRPGMNMQDKQRELAESRAFLSELVAMFPERVSVLELRERPNFPAIIVDDQIFFGHFAHGPVMTPEGFWCRVEGPVESLFESVRVGTEPSAVEERAAYRIVSECAYLLSQANPMDL